MRLRDKVVIVTGASSGMGKAIAIKFAKRGAKVVLAARRIERLKELRDIIFSYNKNCICIKTDVTKEKDVINLFNETEKKFKRVDILINAAGRGLKSKIYDIKTEDWNSVINTNLTGVFLCTREAAKRMMKKGIKGHIITFSSGFGIISVPNQSAYCASKHGVTSFQLCIEPELLKYGILVSTIFPAWVDTEFFKVYRKRPSRSLMLSPYDVADFVLAVASRNPLLVIFFFIFNLIKRVYYFFRYLF